MALFGFIILTIILLIGIAEAVFASYWSFVLAGRISRIALFLVIVLIYALVKLAHHAPFTITTIN